MATPYYAPRPAPVLTHPPPADPRRILAMVVNHWLRKLADRYGGFPRDYMVLDIETSGTDSATDLILNIGHVIVEDGKVVSRGDGLLDWTKEGRVDQQWLFSKMAQTRSQMASRGRTYQMHYADLAERGEDPLDVLQGYYELVREQQAAKYAFVMHNGYNFDAPWLCANWRRWLGKEFDFGPNCIWDTGMIVKASQLNSVPDRADTMQSWSKRVGGIRAKGVYWSLDAHCIPTYDLAKKHNLDLAAAHGAGFDTYVTHLLFEHFREIASQHPPDGGDVREDDGGRYSHLGG